MASSLFVVEASAIDFNGEDSDKLTIARRREEEVGYHSSLVHGTLVEGFLQSTSVVDLRGGRSETRRCEGESREGQQNRVAFCFVNGLRTD